MAAAGLTHGGFYRHFDSKDQIVAEACTAAGESLVEQLAASASEKSPQRGFNTIVENYLSAAHRDEPADGCPIAALGSEIARSDERTRAAATQALLKFVDVIASQSGKTRPDVAQRGALVAAALMIGALTMSRAYRPKYFGKPRINWLNLDDHRVYRFVAFNLFKIQTAMLEILFG